MFWINLLAIMSGVGCSCFLYFFCAKRNKKRLLLLIHAIALLIYLWYLGYVTLFDRIPSAVRTYNLRLFWSYEKCLFYPNTQGLLEEIILNIAAFLPLGFLIPQLFFSKKKLWKIVVSSAFISLGIESAQLFFRLGLFEFDDIFDNTLGAIIGYGLYSAMINIGKITAIGQEEKIRIKKEEAIYKAVYGLLPLVGTSFFWIIFWIVSKWIQRH